MHKRPVFGEIRFSCPHCSALAHQYWAEIRYFELEKDKIPTRYQTEQIENLIKETRTSHNIDENTNKRFLEDALRASKGGVFVSSLRGAPRSNQILNLNASRCESCGEVSIWLRDKLIYPETGPVGMANSDMPPQVKAFFDEAGAVFQTSPRAAAALLRLALQVLLKELGQEGKNIAKDIGNLESQGLDAELSKIMHSVRIIGNEAVHPGVIDVNDEPEMAEVMFDLLNQIVDQMISRPKKNKAIWKKIPEEKRVSVEQNLAKRDKLK